MGGISGLLEPPCKKRHRASRPTHSVQKDDAFCGFSSVFFIRPARCGEADGEQYGEERAEHAV